jgi:WhiB family redox-sensing transcriptional regulator
MNLSWLDYANCKGVDQSVFFLEGHAPPQESRQRVIEAKSYCNACSVKQECLQYAMDSKEKHGIYGGATPVERLSMRNSAKKKRSEELSATP